MKTNTVFKRAHNQWLSRLARCAVGSDVGSEPYWAEALAVSRTTVRSVLAALAAKAAAVLPLVALVPRAARRLFRSSAALVLAAPESVSKPQESRRGRFFLPRRLFFVCPILRSR